MRKHKHLNDVVLYPLNYIYNYTEHCILLVNYLSMPACMLHNSVTIIIILKPYSTAYTLAAFQYVEQTH